MTVRKMMTREATYIAAATLLAVRKEARKLNMKPAALHLLPFDTTPPIRKGRDTAQTVQNFGGFRCRLPVILARFFASKASYSQTAAKMFAMKNAEKLVRMFGKISSYRRCFTSFAEK